MVATSHDELFLERCVTKEPEFCRPPFCMVRKALSFAFVAVLRACPNGFFGAFQSTCLYCKFSMYVCRPCRPTNFCILYISLKLLKEQVSKGTAGAMKPNLVASYSSLAVALPQDSPERDRGGALVPCGRGGQLCSVYYCIPN